MSVWRGSSALVRSGRKTLLGASHRSALSTSVAPSVAESAAATAVAPIEWTPEKKRTGLLAVKIGMMPVWDHYGYRHNCTVLQVEECQVTQVKTADRHGFNALQLGVGLRKARNVTKPVLGHLAKAGVQPKRQLQEFRVSEDALLPLGTTLSALHFNAGQFVDVCGISKGKGFQGVMKLHNFAGQPASHGNSKTQRHMGSTGQCQDPGKVFKGKKMPGRMGGNRVTRDNLWIAKIDVERNLLYVKGSVPGNNGGIVRITDARKKKPTEPLPYPTFLAGKDTALPSEILAPHGEQDPYHYDEN
ncbi:54S ribosomal protein L3 [Phytophthora boehmeriae]|uniref:Large ribosomal subunit protein uL3m n=1 Tax=Phytophthora boehmeriae TaxID=109152 RepID=A0A8T1W4V6_9STRA|nr:54S ribosomal protein L3 [Phytophthora boehmeriae]